MSPHEFIVVTLDTGGQALFVNGAVVLTQETNDSGDRLAEVGKHLAKALGVEVKEISMTAPADNDWRWEDVYELLPPGMPSDAAMLVSLDGGENYLPAPEGVRIIWRDVLIDGEDGLGEVHVNATHEGLITDIWATRDDPLDHNIGTDSVGIDDIVSRLVGNND